MRQIEIPKNFKKVLGKKPRQMQESVARTLELLAEDSRRPSLRVKKMQGVKDVWEASIDKGNRLTFEWGPEGSIILRNNCNHDMLTKNP